MISYRSGAFLVYFLSLICLAFPALSVSAAIPCEWANVKRVVVIGDLHGDYEDFVKILKGTRIVDRDLHWGAGQVHLVQTGDIMDRGRDSRKILDLLRQLEREAEAAGGKVHVLLGNHEEMNITGIVFSSNIDYVTVDQFMDFLPDGYKKHQEEVLSKEIIKLRSRRSPKPEEDVVSEFWSSLRKTPSAQRQYVLNLNSEYGDWLRNLNIAVKINDIVFVHGGISLKYARWGLQELNDRYRLEIGDFWRGYRRSERSKIVRPSILYRGDSPLWYREFATVPEEDLKEELDETLETLGAKAMIIAHTPKIVRTPAEMQRFGGKIWIVDTGISYVYGGPAVALIIQDGYFNVWGLSDEDKNEPESHPSSLFRFGLKSLSHFVSDAR